MLILKSKHVKIIEELEKSYETDLQELANLAEKKLNDTISKYDAELDKADNIISEYEKYMINFDANLKLAFKNIDDVDHSGHFRSDDEVGTFFRCLKTIKDNLEKFMIEKNKFN